MSTPLPPQRTVQIGVVMVSEIGRTDAKKTYFVSDVVSVNAFRRVALMIAALRNVSAVLRARRLRIVGHGVV